MPELRPSDDAPPSYEATLSESTIARRTFHTFAYTDASDSRPTTLIVRRHDTTAGKDNTVNLGRIINRQDDIMLIDASWSLRELSRRIVERAEICGVFTMAEYVTLRAHSHLVIKHEDLFGEPAIRDEASWEAAKRLLFSSENAFLVFSIGFAAEDGRFLLRHEEPGMGIQKVAQVAVAKDGGAGMRKTAKEPVLLPPRHSCVMQ